VAKAKLIATRTYEKRIAKLLPPDERNKMEDAIAAQPDAHPIIPGTRGVRKARWSRPGMGKSGGIRLIYYFWVEPNAVVFISAYSKKQKENLTGADKKDIRKIVESLKRAN
jgi:mRNA-degrading endonuclease RelE of RelBE toxin-antitoxin system